MLKHFLQCVALGLSFVSVAHAAPQVSQPNAPHADAAHVKDTPKQDAPPAQENKIQPGKPVQLIGPSYLLFGDVTLQIGTVDMKEKKALSSIILSPPWDTNGVDICGAGALSKEGNKCVSATASGAVKAPGGVVVPTVHLKALPTAADDNTLVYCDDYTHTVSAGLFKNKTITGDLVISRNNKWVSVSTGDVVN